MTTTTSTNAFITWITTYGQIIGFVVQVIFYIVVATSAAWAAVIFARYVRYMTSEEPLAEASSEEINVDEFVE